MNTLLLDSPSWDLTLNEHGNLAVATGLYAIAQDVASACRTFLGEVWYDTTLGIPYTDRILGYFPPTSFLQAQFEGQGELVPQVASVRAFLDPLTAARTLTGRLEITSTAGQSVVASGAVVAPWYSNAVWPPVPGYASDTFTLGLSILGGSDLLAP